jgi:hypothetical protein
MASHHSLGNNGFFIIPHYRIAGYEIRCMVSDGLGWEHVSVTVAPLGKDATRCPTWEEMCFVKSTFWSEEECVVEYHPPKSQYVSCHPFCLHLWKPIGQAIPVPDPEFVGPKNYIKK